MRNKSEIILKSHFEKKSLLNSHFLYQGFFFLDILLKMSLKKISEEETLDIKSLNFIFFEVFAVKVTYLMLKSRSFFQILF